jgi:hypothetical protein
LFEASQFVHPSEPKSLAGNTESCVRSPFLIVGLGNPGLEYLWTPHNAGFMAIDRIAQQEGVVVQNRRCKAATATCRMAGRVVVLAKPETFMNLSIAGTVRRCGTRGNPKPHLKGWGTMHGPVICK